MNRLDLEMFISRFQLQCPPQSRPVQNTRQAAVLIPIVCRPKPTLLLTRRAMHMRKHAGQIAFPGGAAELGDASLVATALREAEEEIALPHGCVNVIGQLASIDSISGFNVTPILGLIPPDVVFSPNKDEVDDLFEMPLQEALTLSRYYSLDIQRKSSRHRIYLSWYRGHFIWGLTAAVIYRLAKQTSVLDMPYTTYL